MTASTNTASLRGRHVLITGGLGFIGSNLATQCVADGARVTILDNLDAQSGGNPANIADVADDVAMLPYDIRNREQVDAAVRGQEYVFHCAGLTSHAGSMDDPFRNLEVNGGGVLNVLEAMRQHNRDAKIVHVGTSTQIGRMRHEPIDETHSEFPLDIYSANKVVAEKYVLIYGRAHGLRTSVVRLANTFGPRACIRTPAFGFMNFFVGLALQGKEITVYGDGHQQRNLAFVDDSVSALIGAALSEAANGHAFFATADRQVSVRAVADAIADGIGGSVRFVEWPADRVAIEIGDAVISNQKIRSTLGWAPVVPLATGIARTRDYFASRLGEYLP
jgi:UDP-glucose 4-epimerase